MPGSSRGNDMYMLFLLKKYRHPNSKNDITDFSKILSEKYLNEKLIILLFKWRKRQITWKIKLFNLIISENMHLVKTKIVTSIV